MPITDYTRWLSRGMIAYYAVNLAIAIAIMMAALGMKLRDAVRKWRMQ